MAQHKAVVLISMLVLLLSCLRTYFKKYSVKLIRLDTSENPYTYLIFKKSKEKQIAMYLIRKAILMACTSTAQDPSNKQVSRCQSFIPVLDHSET